MAITIVPHAEELKDAVEAFNRRLLQGGKKIGFYVEPTCNWLPPRPGSRVWREYHLAIEDGKVVRGAYALKPQDWLIGGQLRVVSDWQGPVSEGVVDPRYSSMGLRLMRDMTKKRPLLYSFGHGGNDELVVKLIREMGWHTHPVPFALLVLRPRRFLRRNRFLRKDPRLRLALDLLAGSGLGSVGLRALHGALRARYRQRLRSQLKVESEFDTWADDLWARDKDRYAALAVRDAAMMNSLIPRGGWPPAARLRVLRDGQTIGWAVVLHREMKDDPRFGTLHVGNITDVFAGPDDAAEVVHAAVDFLRQQEVDMVYANFAHVSWIRGLEVNGFFVLRNRRLFAMAPALKEALDPLDATLPGLHLTNLDGHGPQDFV